MNNVSTTTWVSPLFISIFMCSSLTQRWGNPCSLQRHEDDEIDEEMPVKAITSIEFLSSDR